MAGLLVWGQHTAIRLLVAFAQVDVPAFLPDEDWGDGNVAIDEACVVQLINTSRTQKLSLRLSEVEFRRITRRAKSCGLTKSAYVRQLIVGYKPRETPPNDYFAMTRELKKIGNNLNQLCFVANVTGLIDEAAYYENVIHLRDSLRRIGKAVVGVADDEGGSAKTK